MQAVEAVPGADAGGPGAVAAPRAIRPRVVLLTHLPPPVHGASLMGSYVVAPGAVTQAFATEVLPLRMTDDVGDLHRFAWRKVGRSVAVILRLARLLARWRPDLCYFTASLDGHALYRDVLLVLVMRLFGVRRVLHLHAQGLAAARQGRPLVGLAQRLVFAGAHVILVTKAVRGDVAPLVDPRRLHYVANGIPDPAGGLRADRAGRDGAVSLLFLSNITRAKGHLVLLEAVAILRRRGVAVRALFAGPWKDEAARRSFEERLRRDDLAGAAVEHLGPVAGERKRAVFAEADIFAYPTELDVFPLVLLEAMAFALPVVSTPVGGIAEIVRDGETGFLVPRGDPVALADALQQLVEEPALRLRLGAAARARFEAEYTRDRFLARLSAALGEALSS